MPRKIISSSCFLLGAAAIAAGCSGGTGDEPSSSPVDLDGTSDEAPSADIAPENIVSDESSSGELESEAAPALRDGHTLIARVQLSETHRVDFVEDESGEFAIDEDYHLDLDQGQPTLHELILASPSQASLR